MDAVIKEQITHFSKFDQPFSWHVYQHDLPQSLPDRLMAQGFAQDDDPDAVLVLDLRSDLPATTVKPAGVEIRRLTQPDQLQDVRRVEQEVLGGDFDWLVKRLADHMEFPEYLSVYVAYVNEQPVCTGWTYFHPGSQFTSLYGGATVEAQRGHGIYHALLDVRVREARQKGRRIVTTGASPMSRPILVKRGFSLLTHAYAYEWEG